MADKQRVCAVSYLNAAPLVWGLLHGPQRGVFDVPLRDPGSVREPAAPPARWTRGWFLRSNWRASRICWSCRVVRSLAKGPSAAFCWCRRSRSTPSSPSPADTSSRTSTVLAQILAAHLHGLRPKVRPYPPRMDEMLEIADAALIIGDPALRIDPALDSWRGAPVHVYDLGTVWEELTGLPMVFAVWAVKRLANTRGIPDKLLESAEYGRARVEEIAVAESARLGFETETVRRYLTRNVRYRLGAREREALALYLRLAAELGLAEALRETPFLAEPVLADQPPE